MGTDASALTVASGSPPPAEDGVPGELVAVGAGAWDVGTGADVPDPPIVTDHGPLVVSTTTV